MTTLADWQIRRAIQRGHLRIDGLPDGALDGGPELQPASIDLRLDSRFRILDPANREDWPWPHLDPAEDSADLFDTVDVDPGATLPLKPGECALAQTFETVTLPADMLARFEGKSSLGRLFLAVHVTAGFIDPSFSGRITLELVNHAPVPIVLRPGMRIDQLALERLDAAAEHDRRLLRVGHRRTTGGVMSDRDAVRRAARRTDDERIAMATREELKAKYARYSTDELLVMACLPMDEEAPALSPRSHPPHREAPSMDNGTRSNPILVTHPDPPDDPPTLAGRLSTIAYGLICGLFPAGCLTWVWTSDPRWAATGGIAAILMFLTLAVVKTIGRGTAARR